jgi:serine/threonine protein kinase/TolB-like protein
MAVDDPLVGRTIGHYRFLEKVGQGGMGVVYRGQDTRLNREVALKLINHELLADADIRRRFLREARAASALSHPNVCTIHAIEEFDDQLFLVLEFLEGSPLRRRGTELRRDLKLLLDSLIQAAEGLAEAHRRGIVHRDIKSDNVWLTPRGLVKIMDFGLAKQVRAPAGGSEETAPTEMATSTGVTLGTVQYMSPEQALGRPVDGRGDIFSFGVVLYEIGTGVMPFTGASSYEVFDHIIRRDPPPPSSVNSELTRDYDRITLKALRKDPGERYQTASDLAVDLRALRREMFPSSQSQMSVAVPAGVAPPPAPTPAPKASRLSSLALVLGTILSVVGLTIGGVALMGGRPGAPQANAESQRPAVAVLPFENRTGDEKMNWYGPNAAALVTVALAQLPNIDVISKQRIFEVMQGLKQGRDATSDAGVSTEAARKSGATLLVRGEALLVAGKLLLTVEVVEVSSGRILDAERVSDVNDQNMGEKVDELSRQVAAKLGGIR